MGFGDLHHFTTDSAHQDTAPAAGHQLLPYVLVQWTDRFEIFIFPTSSILPIPKREREILDTPFLICLLQHLSHP